MNRLTVDRSPLQLFLMGLAGLLLIVAALDIAWFHWISTSPEVHEGLITRRGRGQRTADLVWGITFLITGGALFGVAVVGLARRRASIIVGDDGLEVALQGPANARTFIPWADIVAVRTGSEVDPEGGRPLDVFSIELRDTTGYPVAPWGAWWQGDRLVVDGTGWDTGLGEIVVHAQLALERYRREQIDEGIADQ